MYWQVDPSCYATFVSPLSRLWLETSKFKLSWFLRSIRQPNQSDHDWVEEIDYQSPSQWDLTLIYPDSTLSLTILATTLLFKTEYIYILVNIFKWMPDNSARGQVGPMLRQLGPCYCFIILFNIYVYNYLFI
jgi:hypothetical protein